MPLPFLAPLLGALASGAGSAIAGGLANSSRTKTPGREGNFQQVSRLSPNQIAAQNQALQHALAGLQNPTAGFEPIGAQETKRFNEQTIPSLAERFTAMGNGQRSSAFQGALGNAGADLGGQLAALKAQYGLQNQGQLMQLLNLGLQPQFENAYTPGREESFQGNLASNAFGGLSQGLGSLSNAYGMQALNGVSQQPGTVQPQRSAQQDVQALQSPQTSRAGMAMGGQGGNQGQVNFEDFLRKYLSGMQ